MRIRPALGVFILLAAVAASACSGPTADLKKIGLVTDVGTLEDKSFNEAAWLGVQDAAKEIGGTADNIVTKDPKDYAVNMKTFVDKGFGIIVTSGFALTDATTEAAKKYPNVEFIGTDQFICVDSKGNVDKASPDPSTPPDCDGNESAMPKNFQGLLYNEAQAGYLAGIVAASNASASAV